MQVYPPPNKKLRTGVASGPEDEFHVDSMDMYEKLYKK